MIRPVLALTIAILRRMVRRVMVRRAMIWPGLLSALSLILAVGVVAFLRTSPEIAVSEPALAQALSDAGLEVLDDEDPPTAVGAGRAPRAVWREPTDGHIVLQSDLWAMVLGGGPDTMRAEAALRELEGAGWRLRPQIPPPNFAGLSQAVRWLAVIISVLFTLYAVLIGLGSIATDRQEGVLEAELSLPLPAWTHAAARLLASTIVLTVSYGSTIALIDALVGLADVALWWTYGIASMVAAAGLGVAMMPGGLGSSGGLTAPLTRGLTACTGLIGFGIVAPAIGGFFPIASLGALSSGAAPSPLALALSLVPPAVATWRFHRGLR
ncbi:MAG: ABC transporter permease subunit [Myxococcota bacterium]